jgi:hypothetical protein
MNILHFVKTKSRKLMWETAIELNTVKYDAIQCLKDEWKNQS